MKTCLSLRRLTMTSHAGHEYQDALTYARWGVDYLEYDWCHADDLNAPGAYRTMSEALRAAGRPVVFSVCKWGQNEPWKWAGPLAHLWVTVAEDRAHFSMWAMLSAPLIAGNDLASMSKETLSILANSEVIRVDQDPLVIQAFRYLSLGDLEVWLKPVDKGELAVAFLNRGTTAQPISFDWARHATTDEQFHRRFDFKAKPHRVRDLWAQRDLGTTQTPLTGSVAAHDVWMLRLRP